MRNFAKFGLKKTQSSSEICPLVVRNSGLRQVPCLSRGRRRGGFLRLLPCLRSRCSASNAAGHTQPSDGSFICLSLLQATASRPPPHPGLVPVPCGIVVHVHIVHFRLQSSAAYFLARRTAIRFIKEIFDAHQISSPAALSGWC